MCHYPNLNPIYNRVWIVMENYGKDTIGVDCSEYGSAWNFRSAQRLFPASLRLPLQKQINSLD